MEKLSDKNPCNTCTVDRQIGNPYRHQCECDRCLKPGRWKDECVKKLAEYEDLGEQGKLAKIPCKLHDTVFDLVFCDDGEYRIFEMKVCAVREFGEVRDGKVWNVYLEDKYTKAYRSFYNFGKTVFLTREAAEAALKEMSE